MRLSLRSILSLKSGLLTLALGISLIGATTAQASCKVMVMGDSLSAAYGLPKEQGWVHLMEKKMAEKFPKCAVVNASVSGETSAGGRSRLPALLKQHQPSHMILELGANDGLRGLPISVLKSNLKDMIKQARQANTQTLLVGMQIPPNYGPDYTRQFANTFAEVAQTERVLWIRFLLEGFADNPNAFQQDGIHPNAASQVQMLNNVWPILDQALRGSSR